MVHLLYCKSVYLTYYIHARKKDPTTATYTQANTMYHTGVMCSRAPHWTGLSISMDGVISRPLSGLVMGLTDMRSSLSRHGACMCVHACVCVCVCVCARACVRVCVACIGSSKLDSPSYLCKSQSCCCFLMH